MSTRYPVDSTLCRTCRHIGGHAVSCRQGMSIDLDASHPPADLAGVEVAPTVRGATTDPREVVAVVEQPDDSEFVYLAIPTPMLGIVEQLEVAIPRSRLLAILGGAS